MSLAGSHQNAAISPLAIAVGLGAVSGALILGVLVFQYVVGIPPCEMCHWQRWPHIAAILAGPGGGFVLRRTPRSDQASRLAWATAFLVAMSGVIGVYHAGVEWKLWAGPSACTGNSFHYTGTLDLNARVVMCDIAAWRLFGISLAGYNAIISLGAAAIAAIMLLKPRQK